MRGCAQVGPERATGVPELPAGHGRGRSQRERRQPAEVAPKALVLLVASLVLGAASLAVLVIVALQGKTITAELNNLLWLMVGQLGAVLGVFTDRKALASGG
jgi:hypothetical protein